MRCNNYVVDDTDGTDCWRRRMGGEWSVTTGVTRRSNQNSNEMWWAVCSSDNSRQCHSVANSMADRLTWKCQEIAPQFEHSVSHVTSRHSMANRWKQVDKAGKLGRRRRSRLRQRSCGAQPMHTQVQTMTGSNTYAYIWGIMTWRSLLGGGFCPECLPQISVVLGTLMSVIVQNLNEIRQFPADVIGFT